MASASSMSGDCSFLSIVVHFCFYAENLVILFSFCTSCLFFLSFCIGGEVCLRFSRMNFRVIIYDYMNVLWLRVSLRVS